LPALADADRYRPAHCPQCQAQQPLRGHGFYRRTLVDTGFDGVIRVRRYLCRDCQRTVSLLPQFALPYLCFSVSVIALFLVARLREGRTLRTAVVAAAQPHMPYQRGRFWIRRFQQQVKPTSSFQEGRVSPNQPRASTLRPAASSTR
jgi:hypothetical protein